MSGARFVVESLPSAGGSCVLGREKAAHARARRLAAGDAIVLVDGSGAEASGHIATVARDRVTIAIERLSHVPREDLPAVHLCVAAVRPERLAWIAEKATELGASSLVLVVSERTQRPRAGAGLVPRLRRVVEEAAEQSERVRWPRIDEPIPFASALSRFEEIQRFLLDPRGEPLPAALPLRDTALLIGPEGGWSDAEHAAALAAGWVAASLASGKLRAETAAVAGLALVRSALVRARGSH
ncbi:MAG: RsmE family RNA methyltransferase [Thermoanaerobaculia bacterium]